jgi:hypothetical protein
MPDFKLIIDALIKGAPTALYIALVGIVWQIVYAFVKDFLAHKEAVQKLKLESDKFDFQSKVEKLRFEHQRDLDKQRFDYEKLKWREQLSLEIVKRHLDARLEVYHSLWTLIRSVARHTERSGELTPDQCKAIATEIEGWRYGIGGLLAEETTRDAALALQTALWKYDSTPAGFSKVRQARGLLRDALRADLGLGVNSEGLNIFGVTGIRVGIEEKLAPLKTELKLESDL